MTSVADILRKKGEFTQTTKLVKAIQETLEVSSRQAYRQIEKAEERKEIRKIALSNRSVLYGLPSWPIEIHQKSHNVLREVPRIDFGITQRIANNPFQKREFPNVGFFLKNINRFPIKVRVEALPILGGEKLGFIQDRKKYYNGETIWGPYDYNEGIINANFYVPSECINSPEELTLVVRVIVIDPFNREHIKIKGWTYMPAENDWFSEPKDFSEVFDS